MSAFLLTLRRRISCGLPADGDLERQFARNRIGFFRAHPDEVAGGLGELNQFGFDGRISISSGNFKKTFHIFHDVFP